MRNIPMYIMSVVLAGTLTAGPLPEAKNKTAETKVKDPVCGMMVDPKTSDKAAYKGKTYYFCSREEKAEFEKNPSKYAKK